MDIDDMDDEQLERLAKEAEVTVSEFRNIIREYDKLKETLPLDERVELERFIANNSRLRPRM
jgi:hypothetical protein